MKSFRLVSATILVFTGLWLTALAASNTNSAAPKAQSVTQPQGAPSIGSANESLLAAPASTPVNPSPASITTAAATTLFLGAVEQFGVGSGQIDLFNVNLGGSGGPDTFAAASPATLAVTNSTNEGKPDVNNPQTVLWDNPGDLLIGNGVDGGANHGTMACVPAGAVISGANASTTVSTNVTSPTGMAYDSRDGSVALANNPATATYQLSEYLLTTIYAAAPAARNLHVAGTNVGSHTVTNMVPLSGSFPATGTYAITITNGCEQDAAHANCGGTTPVNKVAIFSASGVETDITDTSTFSVDLPFGIAWDAQNSQLIIANNGTWHNSIAFYTITAGGPTGITATKTKVISVPGTQPTWVAVSPDGHVAVVSTPGLFNPQIQVYDNTAARNPVSGPIPYNGTSDTSCGTYIYGDATVNALTWLSNTKLLVAVQSYNSGVVSSLNGLYIYDTTVTAVPAGHPDNDPNCGTNPGGFASAPKQTGFVHLGQKPLAIAIRPGLVNYADPAGTCGGNKPCFSSINTAIANISTGGVVNVVGGTFNESVVLNNSAVTVNINGNTTVNDLTISAGTLTGGGGACAQAVSYALTLATGNWTNNGGTFLSGGGTVIFNGSAAQSVTGTQPTSFNNLTINNATGVTLSAPATVNGILTLTNGVLHNGANLTLASAASIVRNNSGAPGGSLASVPTFGTTANLTYTGNVAITSGPEIPAAGTVLSNLTINNSAGVNLNSNASVIGTLTLQSGAFAVGTNTLTVNSAIAVTSGTLTSGATGTVNYNQGSNGQAVIVANYGNLTFSNFIKTLPSSGIVSIAGTFTTGATGGHTITGSTIQFNGTSAQTLPANFTTYNNLTINNASGVTLGGNITVNGAFTLTSGNVTTTVVNILAIGASGTRSRTSGYIIGNEKKTYSANGSFTYDVGTANGYSPVDVTTTAGTGDLTVVAVPGAEPSVVANRSLARYWTLSKGGAGVTANLVFHYLDPTDIMGTESNYQVLQVTGGVRTYYTNSCPAPCVNGAANTFALNGVTNFSDFTAGEARADLQTSNSAAANVIVGNNLTYTIGVTNGGPDTSTSPTVSDAIPAQTTLVSVTTPAGWTRTDSVPVGGTGTIGFSKSSMANAETATFTIVVKVNANAVGGSTISDTATAASAITIDPDLTNNSGTAMTVAYTPPAITSGNNTTFVVGTAGSFTVTTTGYPTPTVAESGTLPNGVSFDTSTNKLSGTPTAGTGGTYPITFTASNAAGSTPAQSFTLTVNQAPAITSANTTTFTAATVGNFNVIATGYPSPTINLTAGSLPSGVNYGNGTLAGTAAANAFGTYPLTFTASNGVGSDAVQSFSLVVNPSVQDVKSKPSVTANVGGGFHVAFIGNPGTQYTIQFAPTLPPLPAVPNWQTLSLQTASASGMFSVDDTPPGGTTQRFYRAIIP